MLVLLDTNIWRYLVDGGFGDSLFQETRRSNKRVAIAPAVIIESLRMSDPKLRKKIIELQTRGCWERLMPDSFLECEDVKREMLTIHPEWALEEENSNLFRKLRYDWLRSKGGFWEKVRVETEKVANHYRLRDSSTLEEVRSQLRDARKSVVDTGNRILNTNSLDDLKGSWRPLPDIPE